MSALSFARHAFGFEKPHSSVTDWIDILTSSKIEEEAYEGIPELVDAITLQASGPAEAARALRKKLKHGQPHQQYRALVLIKALVENAGPKFHAAFSDDQIVDAFKQLNFDSQTDKRVKKKLIMVLASWRDQYRADPSMSLFAGLYRQCKGDSRVQSPPAELIQPDTAKEEKKKAKEDAKRREKMEREERRKKEEEERRKSSARVPFNLEKERPKVLSSIAEASQASSNLANAIMLINTETERIQESARVQDYLTKAKQARKALVRYIQLVEDEDLIGTLIETNDRLIAALQLYDNSSVKDVENAPENAKDLARSLAVARISGLNSNGYGSPEGQAIATVQDAGVHPDLQDLNFGPLGASSSRLPVPIKPSKFSDSYHDSERGSLSDFSDYVSPDEDTRGSPQREYIDLSDGQEDDTSTKKAVRQAHVVSSEDDPFADPFADGFALPISK
ncbi:hypothetical protein AX15_001558 [Amanita polypyramis BW_CC]|nr:hypothetical protein AX15_001558 [Amanita polypyramis BW_CC]